MQRQEGFLFGCAFHAWFYSRKLKRCGNSCLLSFRQRLEVLTLKYHQDKMIKLHRFGLESQNKRISWAGKHKDHRAQLLDVQIGLGWKEPDFQIWQTGSTGCSASWKLGVLSWRSQSFSRHIWASIILQVSGCGGKENAQMPWEISWRWYFLSQRKIKITLQKPKTEMIKNFNGI